MVVPRTAGALSSGKQTAMGIKDKLQETAHARQRQIIFVCCQKTLGQMTRLLDGSSSSPSAESASAGNDEHDV